MGFDTDRVERETRAAIKEHLKEIPKAGEVKLVTSFSEFRRYFGGFSTNVEQRNLALGREIRDVTLEVPLALLALGRLVQRDNLSAARIQMLSEALDRAALAGRITALEQDHMLGASPL